MRIEVLSDSVSKRGTRARNSMAEAAPFEVRNTASYEGGCDVLLLWGRGRSDHKAAWAAQLASGGRCVGLDMGYFGREQDMFRLHVDAPHPTREQVYAAPAHGRCSFTPREDADPEGPILMIGMGNKSIADLGLKFGDWEIKTLKRIKSVYPKREVFWRPKYANRGVGMPPDKSLNLLSPDIPIEDALKGKSLVVCRHSNVGIDACIAGVPVWCEGGAAHALYQNTPSPTPAQRLDLLNRVSWFNYAHEESAEAWNFITRTLFV